MVLWPYKSPQRAREKPTSFCQAQSYPSSRLLSSLAHNLESTVEWSLLLPAPRSNSCYRSTSHGRAIPNRRSFKLFDDDPNLAIAARRGSCRLATDAGFRWRRKISHGESNPYLAVGQ